MTETAGAHKVIVSEPVAGVFDKLTENAAVRRAFDFLEADNDRTTEEQIELTEIEAPTFEEEEKGRAFARKLAELGVEDISVDEVGNVFGVRPGRGGGPKLVVCAHLDTVFPRGTNVKARREGSRVYAPGISDDGRGLASVLTILRALNEADLWTEGDLIVGATVGEEGLGDLRGVKALFAGRSDIDGFISIEPGTPDRITYLAAGSKRYKITFEGPGGHSFGSFGTPSPIHALGRAVAKFADLQVPHDPKTTFNVGMIGGGTSVNTIAETAEAVIDMRSISQAELEKLETEALTLFRQAAEEENDRWRRAGAIKVHMERVGDRPAGSQEASSMIVQAAAGAGLAMGFRPILEGASSTDSNIPIHLGIPAVTLGGGGDFGGAHTLNEYYDPTGAHLGVQKILLTVLSLTGLAGTTQPLLTKRG
ncbi:M20/M25/M40 family metallo-hydrolase [Saccharibacillus alkalitolerans]|uniref:M20/M25/M40 family metallo-hydrolase n=1 Tax=Saccharibacillus alkalitolerans TaxID=2705290 RepID=A0ABX0F807_9BACL|nr:M20/M25/M40 family metallo-hydrolase [Saccharibacillus alkalitolerans]NGZ77086.1 M20/M25/M40 family metallo-hydrolase [Saccharibacillus alkalitolerans]